MNFARDCNFSRIYIFKSAESGQLAWLYSSDDYKKYTDFHKYLMICSYGNYRNPKD